MVNKNRQQNKLDQKIGILGGGQLGKMLAQSAADFQLHLSALDKSDQVSAAPYVHDFQVGDFNNYEDVLEFGKDKDIITVEIEHVNTRALIELKKQGKIIHPAPEALEIIKDKALQKRFFEEKGFLSSTYRVFDDANSIWNALSAGAIKFPFVQKTRTAGYDGYGVKIIRDTDDAEEMMDAPCIAEKLVDIKMEIAVVVARNESGEIAAYPPVEMDFHPEANMVDFVKSPAQIPSIIGEEAVRTAKMLIEAFDICGLLAIEFFWTSAGVLLVNEVAPRPHNSGHITMDNNNTSQFEQHLRGIMNWPLGDTANSSPAVMFNLLGHPDYKGVATYEGLHECLSTPRLHLHLYGKKMTKPYRKMGHVTILDKDINKAYEVAQFVKKQILVKSI